MTPPIQYHAPPSPSVQCALDPETGEATDDLTPDAAEVIRTVYGRGYTKASEILESDDEAISKATVYGITQYNQKHASSYNQKVEPALCGLPCL